MTITREEAIMANDSQKAKKIKTPFAKMIVERNQEKPYFSILYFDPIDKNFYVGYSSYCLDYVSNWLNEEFEIVEDKNFIIATLTPPNEPLTWEELTAETKINPVYSMKYGWIFPNTIKDEPYKQVWFFTSKGFANTELFYRDTFYYRPPEGEEDT